MKSFDVFKIGTLLAVGLYFFDSILTYVGIQYFGMVETVPVTAWFMSAFDNLQGLTVKGIVFAVPFFAAVGMACMKFQGIINAINPRYSFMAHFPLFSAAAVQVPAVVNNISLLAVA